VVKARPRGSEPGLADEALAFIGALYRVERRCTDQKLSVDERLAYRQQYSTPIIEAFKTWLDRHVGTTLPKSLLGTAMRYTLKRWAALTRFLECGALELDTNALEQVIKTVAIARKNFLFAHSPAGARAIANLYTLIETAKANGLEPLAYLKYVFTVLPGATSVEAVEALLPWRYTETLKAVTPEVSSLAAA
jgi:transposase